MPNSPWPNFDLGIVNWVMKKTFFKKDRHGVISPNRDNRIFQVVASFLTQINLFPESDFYRSYIWGVELLTILASAFSSILIIRNLPFVSEYYILKTHVKLNDLVTHFTMQLPNLQINTWMSNLILFWCSSQQRHQLLFKGIPCSFREFAWLNKDL